MEKTRRQFSAVNSHRLLLVLVLAVTILNIAVSAWSVGNVRTGMRDSAHAVVQSRVDQMYDKLSEVNQSLKRMLVESYQEADLVKALDSDTLTRIQNRTKLIDRCKYIVADAGDEYILFYYFQNSGEYLVLHHSSSVSFSQRVPLENAISAHIGTLSETDGNRSTSWEILESEDVYYAAKVFQYNGIWIGSCVPVEALTAPLAALYPEQEAIALCVTSEGEIISGQDALDSRGISRRIVSGNQSSFWHGGKRWMAVAAKHEALGFQIWLLLPEFDQFERVILVQTVAVTIVEVVLFIVILGMAYTQHRILRPLRTFTEGLKHFDPDRPLLTRMDGQIRELADANDSFSNLIKEIQRLRMDAYEQKLEMQKTQMDYMQLQIKPHFFLNSLNLIHTMVMQGDTKEAALLSEVTAKYLRYIFQSDAPSLPLRMEIDHVRDYLSIMSFRYPDQFSYEIVTEEAAQTQLLPPLILQTFVENAIRHAMCPDRRLEITISALCEQMPIAENGPEEPILTIFVTDNGCGFTKEQTELWQSGRQLAHSGGHHIGISNAARRLQLAYGDRARLLLYNSPLGGAVVELRIPCKEQEEEPRESAVC